MLGFLKYNLFLAIIAVLMACSAPTSSTANQLADTPVVELPSTPSTTIPDLPNNIGDVLDSAVSGYWAGAVNGATSFYLDKQGLDNEWSWRIRIRNRDGSGETVYYALSMNSNNSNNVSGGQWKTNFYLKHPNYGQNGSPKVDSASKMDFTMLFYTAKTARVTFSPARENTNLHAINYGTFGVQAM